MRSYGQFCGVARALDAVGDRWSLLVVRELLVRDCRYTDLQTGLPGIATNLLADRLRSLEAAEIVERVETGPPIATTLYRLTARGCQLAPVLRELARWSMPLMAKGQQGDEARGHWLVAAADALFHGAKLRDIAPLRIVAECEGETLTFEVVRPGRLVARLGGDDDADVRLTGSAEAVIGALAGLPAHEPASIAGDAARLRELQSRVPALRGP